MVAYQRQQAPVLYLDEVRKTLRVGNGQRMGQPAGTTR